MRARVPSAKQGAMKGVQYFISTKSGRSRRIRRPTRTQFSGFIVLTQRQMRTSAGGGVTPFLFRQPSGSHARASVSNSSGPGILQREGLDVDLVARKRRWNVRAMISMIEAKWAGPPLKSLFSSYQSIPAISCRSSDPASRRLRPRQSPAPLREELMRRPGFAQVPANDSGTKITEKTGPRQKDSVFCVRSAFRRANRYSPPPE